MLFQHSRLVYPYNLYFIIRSFDLKLNLFRDIPSKLRRSTIKSEIFRFFVLTGCGDVSAAVKGGQQLGTKGKSSSRSKSASLSSKVGSWKWSQKGKRGQQSETSDTELAAIGGRDTSLFLFRALGKILYCKREYE